MKNTFLKPASIALVLSLFVFSSGCDGNDNDEASQSFDQMSTMMGSAFNTFGAVAADIIITSSQKSKPIYDCDDSGTVDYNSTGTPNVYSLVLNGCDGIDGTVNLGLVTDISETGITLDLSLDGNLTEACTMTMNNFSMRVTSTQSGASEIVLGGGLASTCNDEAFSCTFNNSSLTSGSETALVEQNCSASIG